MKNTMTFTEAAVYLNISETVLSELLTSGELPGAKISKDWVVRQCDLDNYLAREVERQTEQRRQAHASGAPSKVSTAFGLFRERAKPRRARGIAPALPALPGRSGFEV